MNFNHTDLGSNVFKILQGFLVLNLLPVSCRCAKKDRYVHVGNPFYIIQSQM